MTENSTSTHATTRKSIRKQLLPQQLTTDQHLKTLRACMLEHTAPRSGCLLSDIRLEFARYRHALRRVSKEIGVAA